MSRTDTAPARHGRTAAGLARALVALAAIAGAAPLAAEEAGTTTLTVAVREVDDLKAVYATVRSKDVVEARVRTPGTISKLEVVDGEQVVAGQVLARVSDDKLALRLEAIEARIVAFTSTMKTAKADLDRGKELRTRNVIAQARLDELRNAYEVASNNLKAAQAERAVIETEREEGDVLAPANGRVLRVPVTQGSVVMAGESIATIAANDYLLRVELPERHARFLKAGDPIIVGPRTLADAEAATPTGRIVLVYPELQNGRVVADAEVTGLGDYFVGERALAWISAGRREAIVVPAAFVMKRGGFDYVRLARGAEPPIEVVVQLGRESATAGGEAEVEVLAGLAAGDVLVRP